MVFQDFSRKVYGFAASEGILLYLPTKKYVNQVCYTFTPYSGFLGHRVYYFPGYFLKTGPFPGFPGSVDTLSYLRVIKILLLELFKFLCK